MSAKIQTTANALNGQEIKDIIKVRLEKIIQDIPLLRVGNTFASASVEFAFSMKAYPADIPVPDDFEVEFELLPPSDEDKQSAENLKKFVNKLIDQRDEVFEKFEEQIGKYVMMIENGDSFSTASAPDKTRIENNLPIPVIQETSTGQRVEVAIDAKDLNLHTNKGGMIGK
jgi:hypothetical protein